MMFTKMLLKKRVKDRAIISEYDNRKKNLLP